MSSLLLVALLAAGQYPLSAAFVVDGKLLVAQMGAAEQEVIPTPDMVVRSADLSPDRSTVVATAQVGGAAFDQVFAFNRKSRQWRPLETGIKGGHRTPRFTPDGKYITFAASNSEEGGPDHPTQVWRIESSPRQGSAAKRLSTQTDYCHFSPSPLGSDRFASVGTNCFFDFEVRVVGPSKKTSLRLGATHGAVDEVASSFDGETVLTTERLDGDYVFSIFRKGTEKQRLHAFKSTTSTSPQPRFICPRDVMFIENGQFKVLNTKSGETKFVGENAQ